MDAARRCSSSAKASTAASPAPSPTATAGAVTDAASDMRDVIDAAARSNVSIFAIDPRGLPGRPPQPSSRSRRCRRVTPRARWSRSKAWRSWRTRPAALRWSAQRVQRRLRARGPREQLPYYMLGIYLEQPVARRKVPAHRGARQTPRPRDPRPPGYVASADQPAATTPQKSRRHRTGARRCAGEPALSTRSGAGADDVGGSGDVPRGVKSKASVVVIVEARGGELLLAVIVAAANPDGTIKAEEHGTLDLEAVRCVGPAAAEDCTVRLVSRLNLRPVATNCASPRSITRARARSVAFRHGRAGSKGPLAMSGVLLASAAGGRGADRRH